MGIRSRLFKAPLLSVGIVLAMSLVLGCGGGGSGSPATPGTSGSTATMPVFVLHPSDMTVQPGSSAMFVAGASGSPSPTYQWERSADGVNWVPINGATQLSYTLTAQTSDNSAKFRVKANNSAGSATSNTATLTVTSGTAPAIAGFSAGPSTITAGRGSILSYSFSGGMGSINQGVGAVTSGGTSNVAPAISTTYTLTVINTAGNSATANTTVTVVAAPVITSFTAMPPSIVSGQSTTLTANFTGGTGVVDNGVGTVSSGVGATTSPSSTRTYTLTVTNAAGTAVTAAINVVVNNSAGYSISGRIADAANVGVPAVTVTYTGSTSGSVSTDTSGNYTITGLANGSYVLTPAKTGCTFNPTSTTVLVNGANLTGKNFSEASGSPSPGGGAFTSTGLMTIGRYNHTATRLGDGTVLLVGGLTPLGKTASAEIYNPSTNTFSAASGAMAVKRAEHAAVLLRNGKVLVVGGNNYVSSMYKMAELYDPSTQTFTSVGPMAQDRSSAGCIGVLLGDGRVLIAGGDYSSTAEIYDPVLNKFLSTGSMVVSRWSNMASTILNDGKVLVVGGGSNSAELYNPTTGVFTATGAPTAVIGDHLTTLLADGKVLLTGVSGSISNIAELYDPSTGRFTTTGAMSAFPPGCSAVRLQNGQVLLVGLDVGETHRYPPNLYDPATGIFSETGFMAKSTYYHTATLLADGSALVAGGMTGGGIITDRAELYNAGGASSTPVFTLQPQSQTVAAGTSVTFNASANGSPVPAYQWERSADGATWVPISGATQATYTFTAQTADNLTWFRVKASNGAGTAISSAVKITVTAGTPPASGSYGSDYYPMAIGNNWQYEGTTATGHKYTEGYTVLSASSTSATVHYSNSDIITGQGSDFNYKLNGKDMYNINISNSAGVYSTYNPMEPILLPDSSFGTSLTYTGSNQGATINQTETVDSRIVGTEVVTTPLGTFNAVRIESTYTYTNSNYTSKVYSIAFYVKGIGRIKSLTTASAPTSTTVWDQSLLTSYNIY